MGMLWHEFHKWKKFVPIREIRGKKLQSALERDTATS
jgi:hypothetical protein